MKYPYVEPPARNSSVVSSFDGLNQLPVGRDSESDEFQNLLFDLYPAAASGGFSGAYDIYIKSDGACIVPSDVQCIYELCEKDGKKYMTGVAGGYFYFEGEKKEYSGLEDFVITAQDKVEIKKSGTRYIIFATEGIHSKIWEYNTLGTSNGTETQREKDGKLKSDMLGEYLPPDYQNMPLYLYKMTGGPNYEPRMEYIEEASKKSYYMVFMADSAVSDGDQYPSRAKAYEEYKKYLGRQGSILYLSVSESDRLRLNPEKYCFDDFLSEHPVRFVIDACGQSSKDNGVINVLDALYENEGAKYDIVYKSGKTKLPFIPRRPGGSEILRNIFYYDEENKYTLKARTTIFSKNNESGNKIESGIIGHFEKWNDTLKRYDYVYDDSPIYGYLDGNGEDIAKFGYNVYPEYSCTAIKLNYIGVLTGAESADNFCLYQNRAYLTTTEKELIYSGLGRYTDFMPESEADGGFLSIGEDEDIEALTEYSNSLLAFTKTKTYIYYGAGSDMTLSRVIKNAGCIDKNSIAECGGNLIYLSNNGFYAFSGANPQKISQKLTETFKNAVAVSKDDKYIVCAKNDITKYLMFDIAYGWSVLTSDTNAEGTTFDGKFYSGAKVFEFEGIKSSDWVYSSKDLFESIMTDKGINEIYVRAKLSGSMKCEVFADGDLVYEREVTSLGEKPEIFRFPCRFVHKNFYRIRLSGAGSVTLYSIERFAYIGGLKR